MKIDYIFFYTFLIMYINFPFLKFDILVIFVTHSLVWILTCISRKV